ncbi:hypothetical protein IVB38_22070 [Bradyrhizobium sp. 38]|uniref:hypothetical protein n=1 Tax=unclassified Bradyrhizobium TaxID=2631580 RepID=UPI001FF8C064|nr:MULTISPECIES: hypothetical protein [unclassified Bradyrhizobium]MCK1338623.1 hypothetical protein [Bradyrhizobium sp. 38]MCK1776029.1 hypothetical protein [Bradyrhizobium sp. 132]
MWYNQPEVRFLLFLSAFALCIPVAAMIFVQLKLLGKAENDEGSANRERRLARLYKVFDAVYLSYTLLVVAVAVVVGLNSIGFDSIKVYFLPMGFSGTLWVLNGRNKKSSEAAAILAKVLSGFSEYARRTGISGVQLANESVTKSWPPFALFLRSFHLEQHSPNPFAKDFKENEHERRLVHLVEGETKLFVLGLGKEVLSGAARLQLSSELNWKEAVFWLAAAADVIFLWPGSTDGTIWEINICLSHFSRKTIFYAPKLDPYFMSDEDKQLLKEFSFMADVLREVGFETPMLFGENTFWIYAGDKTFRAFNNAVESCAYVHENALEQRTSN